MNTNAIRTLQRQAAGALFAAVMTLAMLANIGALATPGTSNAALVAASQHQLARQPV